MLLCIKDYENFTAKGEYSMKPDIAFMILISLFSISCAISATADQEKENKGSASSQGGNTVGNATNTGQNLATATFAGGCFWCMQPPFEELAGVVSTNVGYTGGFKVNPTYEEVSAGGTGHAESIQIVYDPAKITYEKLLDVFWKNIDPTVKDQQFCDHGHQYRAAVFYHDDEQKRLAEASKEKVAQRIGTVYTEIVQASTFYPAEEYHQDYHKKNPIRYKFYRTTCGRDKRLKEVWGK
jgi:peptide-methionine (S)-S-oxide reductase